MMNNILRNLLMAQRCAQVHHWQVKSLSLHLALGELYELLTDFADELAEFYMGMTGETVNPEQSDPNHFSQQNPLEFIRQLHDVLSDLKSSVPNEGLLISKYEELQGEVAKIKYKMENLR
jgi:DNA-binding ferritin-like protein